MVFYGMNSQNTYTGDVSSLIWITHFTEPRPPFNSRMNTSFFSQAPSWNAEGHPRAQPVSNASWPEVHSGDFVATESFHPVASFYDSMTYFPLGEEACLDINGLFSLQEGCVQEVPDEPPFLVSPSVLPRTNAPYHHSYSSDAYHAVLEPKYGVTPLRSESDTHAKVLAAPGYRPMESCGPMIFGSSFDTHIQPVDSWTNDLSQQIGWNRLATQSDGSEAIRDIAGCFPDWPQTFCSPSPCSGKPLELGLDDCSVTRDIPIIAQTAWGIARAYREDLTPSTVPLETVQDSAR